MYKVNINILTVYSSNIIMVYNLFALLAGNSSVFMLYADIFVAVVLLMFKVY